MVFDARNDMKDFQMNLFCSSASVSQHFSFEEKIKSSNFSSPLFFHYPNVRTRFKNICPSLRLHPSCFLSMRILSLSSSFALVKRKVLRSSLIANLFAFSPITRSINPLLSHKNRFVPPESMEERLSNG